MRGRPIDRVIGVDFGAPRRAHDQRRKIVAIEARATGWHHYQIEAAGLNARLLAGDAPGFSAVDLLDELLERPAKVVGFDFPFSLPEALLRDESFAASVGYRYGPFLGWRAFSGFVERNLELIDPLDFSLFAPWREPKDRARLWTRRETDLAARGQPPLKDKFQATFQMTLLGNALLSKLWDSNRYRVIPFPGTSGGENDIIEVYPGATLRAMGLTNYKSRPEEAIRLAIGACQAGGISLDVDLRVMAFCCRYSSGSARSPDHDGADAFVALCTAILYREGGCWAASTGARSTALTEGTIWVPKLQVSEAAGP